MLPQKLIQSLEGLDGFNKEAFEKIHISKNQLTSFRINPLKWNADEIKKYSHLSVEASIPWSEYGYYVENRPSFTFDPFFHAGAYYVQEASSMFLEQALKQTVDLSKPLKILDISAAPGGKSTHIQSLISEDSLLVSNEVIRSRVNILRDNIIKWGCRNVMVTNNDPKDFARLNNYFDVIVVDAPCSGSGLFRRDPAAIDEWSENNVQLCSQRQQRILSDVWPALKNNGIIIYSTCSYSKEEDEDIIAWMLESFPIAFPIGIGSPLTIDSKWGITESTNGYRFWPDKVKGEGFFISVLQKKQEEESRVVRSRERRELATKKERSIIEKWARPEGSAFIKHKETVYAWPQDLFDDFNYLLQELRVVYSGIRIGELVREKLIPDHALAMSCVLHDEVPTISLDYNQAIEYLKKKEIKIDPHSTGWKLARYKEQALGWVNILPSRINNYYPKELRILKDN